MDRSAMRLVVQLAIDAERALDAVPRGGMSRCTAVALSAIKEHFGLPALQECDIPPDGAAMLSKIAASGLKYRMAWDADGTTVRAFVSAHPEGVWYLAVSGHAMALIDGVLIDTTKRGADGRRLIAAAQVYRGSSPALDSATGKRRIEKNARGNWVGHVGSKRVEEFGDGDHAEADAEEWLKTGERYDARDGAKRKQALDAVDPDTLKAAGEGDALSRIKAAAALRAQLATNGTTGHAMRVHNRGSSAGEPAMTNNADQDYLFQRYITGTPVARYKGETNASGRRPRSVAYAEIRKSKDGAFIEKITIGHGGVNGSLGTRYQEFATEAEARQWADATTRPGFETHEVTELSASETPNAAEPAPAVGPEAILSSAKENAAKFGLRVTARNAGGRGGVHGTAFTYTATLPNGKRGVVRLGVGGRENGMYKFWHGDDTVVGMIHERELWALQKEAEKPSEPAPAESPAEPAKVEPATGGIDLHAMRAQNGGSKSEGAATMTIANFPMVAKVLSERERARFESALKSLTDGADAGQIANATLKDAKDALSRIAGEAWRRVISDVHVNAGKWESLPAGLMEAAPSPHGLNDYRFNGKKLAAIKVQHQMVDDMRALTAEVMPLVELVDGLKGKAVKKQPKTEEQKREEAVQRAIPKTPFSQAVWDAVMTKKPELEAEYKAWMKGLFDDMVKELGPRWADIVSMKPQRGYGESYDIRQDGVLEELGVSPRRALRFRNLFERTLSKFVSLTAKSNDYREHAYGSAGITGSLNEGALAEHAKQYADDVALAIVGKIQAKAGELENPQVDGNLSGFEFRLSGEFNGNKVVIQQGTKLVVNAYGTAFNQWPALIYVNGKFMPEAGYKQWMTGG